MAFDYDNSPLKLLCRSTKEVSLQELQKSKYVQGYIGDALIRIKKDLDAGSKVLFCGTPCQVAGLTQYLRKDYNNLITCDFVCHGVASMDMLRKHLDYKGFRNIRKIDFRPKTRGWVSDFIIDYDARGKYIERIMHDIYCRNFYENLILRKSCFNCHYCNGKRKADISLADFWGYRRFDPTIGDAKGLSLVLANTDKGIDIMDKIIQMQDASIKEIDLKYATYVYENKRNETNSGYDIKKRNEIIDSYYSMDYWEATKKTGFKINWIKFIYDHIMFKIR